ncbi:MAG: PilZ domain-containing protein [Archangiaceae bacterium]|nr:PilZ domain-containing protein [Archangiaceae bacterium]
MSNNKRKNSRVALDIYLNKYVAGVPYMARTSDISREGVGLSHLIEPQMAGKRVGLQFQLPGSEEVIYAEGEVVREWADLDHEEEGSGVRFTLLTERHRRLIDQFVSRAS